MRAQILTAFVTFLVLAPLAMAQCPARDLPCLEHLASAFPPLTELEPSLADNLVTKLSLQPSGAFKAAPTDPEVGRAAAWKTALWDNLTVHADGTFTETLERTLQTGGALTRFQLTGVKFVPTICRLSSNSERRPYDLNAGLSCRRLSQ